MERRDSLIQTLPHDSMLRMVLVKAANKSMRLMIKADASDAKDSSTDQALTTENETEDHMEMSLGIDELRDWFGILIQSPPAQPEPEEWVKEELNNAVRLWVDDGSIPAPSIWDEYTTISPGT